MTEAERRALSGIIRSLADLMGVCETVSRVLIDSGHTESAMILAKSSVDLTQCIVDAWPILGVDPSMLLARRKDTDASTN